jgi:PAS domain S-box-containing protein
MRQKNIKDFFAGANHDELLQAFAQLINGQEIKGLEIRARSSGGEIFEYEVNAIPLKEHGEVTRILSLARDITERKQAEEALRESEARYRTVSELTSDYAYSVCVEANGNLVLEWITDAFTRIFGFTPNEIPAKGGWASLVHPDDQPIVLRRRGVLLSGQSDTSEYRLLTKGGEVRWVRDHGQAVWDEAQGRVVRIIGAAQDITERKRMEEMLRERIVQEKVIPANLRKFRKELHLSQTEFGQAFGSYSQRQMNSYESGEVEVPLGLLLTIREKGYPLEAVLGSGKADAIDAVIGYLASSRKIHEMVRQLAEAILRISDQEREVINHIFHQLDPPRRRGAIEGGKILNEILRRAGISFERSEG